MIDSTADEVFAAFQDAAGRIRYRLGFKYDPHVTFTHAPSWNQAVIERPPMANAYRPTNHAEKQPGEWMWDSAPTDVTSDLAVRRYFEAAIAEAIHEVCEWFRVDGDIYVDPHSQQFEDASYEAGRAATRVILGAV